MGSVRATCRGWVSAALHCLPACVLPTEKSLVLIFAPRYAMSFFFFFFSVTGVKIFSISVAIDNFIIMGLSVIFPVLVLRAR